ncbi:hypothetical protein [Geminisphaera colitermitum]|uniref:hypothetical protein n=1 Tax=Geminisphaera colitermitum TaxID=1148786 RepID=UPI000158CCDC|nr:hypothetical protein [Geminisphaera colitermitum]
MTVDPLYFVYGAMIASLAIMQINQRRVSPMLAIVNRWLRLLIFSLGGAVVIRGLEWTDRPLPALALALLLVWFLGDTIYSWLAIKALSLSTLPVFPRFSVNSSGEEWPTDPRFLRVRDWLRREGFKQVQSLRAEITPNLPLRTSIYQDAEARIRLQVSFLPQQASAIAMCLQFASNTTGGQRIVTDNLFLPFAGFLYLPVVGFNPENWVVHRLPLCRSPQKLLAHHQERLARVGDASCPWTTEPLSDLTGQQIELEQINTELGFLFPPRDREEHGKITYEGRYRVWKECCFLNYFGRAGRLE